MLQYKSNYKKEIHSIYSLLMLWVLKRRRRDGVDETDGYVVSFVKLKTKMKFELFYVVYYLCARWVGNLVIRGAGRPEYTPTTKALRYFLRDLRNN